MKTWVVWDGRFRTNPDRATVLDVIAEDCLEPGKTAIQMIRDTQAGQDVVVEECEDNGGDTLENGKVVLDESCLRSNSEVENAQ